MNRRNTVAIMLVAITIISICAWVLVAPSIAENQAVKLLRALGAEVTTEPTCWGLLLSAREVAFNNPAVSDNDLKVLRSCRNVVYLSLAGTRVTDAGVNGLPVFPELVYLDVGNTKVSDKAIDSLKRFPMLGGVRLSATKITNEGVRLLASTPRFTVVEVAETVVDDDGLLLLHRKLITTLDISRTRSGSRPEAFAGWNVLVVLRAAGTTIDDDAIEALSRDSAALRELDLRGTGVSDLGLAYLARFPRLSILDLSNTGITDFGILKVSEVKCLRVLRLRGTRVTTNGLLALDLPHVSILDVRDTEIAESDFPLIRDRFPMVSFDMGTGSGDARGAETPPGQGPKGQKKEKEKEKKGRHLVDEGSQPE